MKRVLLFMIFLSFFQTTHLQSQHIDFTYQKAYPFFYPMTRGQIKILPDKEGLVYNLTYIQAQAQTSWNFFEKINWEGEYQWNHINGNSIGTGYFGQYIELWENGDFSIAVRKRTSSGFNTGVINRFDADGSSISNNGFTSTDPNIVFLKETPDDGLLKGGAFLNSVSGIAQKSYISKTGGVNNWSSVLDFCIHKLICNNDNTYLGAGVEDAITYHYNGGWKQNADTHITVSKFDEEGNTLWQQNYGKEGRYVLGDMISTNDGNIAIVGAMRDSLVPFFSPFLLVLDQDANEEFFMVDTAYVSDETAFLQKIVQYDDGSFLVGGTTSYIPNLSNSLSFKCDAIFMRLSSDGTLIWSETKGGSATELLLDLVLTDEEEVLFAGLTKSADGDLENIGITGSYNNSVWFGEIEVNDELLPDLTLINTPSLMEVDQGDSITINFEEYNIGSAVANTNYVSAAFLSEDEVFDATDIYLTEMDGSAPPIGMSTSVDLTLEIPNVATGNYYILLVADYNDAIVEINNSNNAISYPITIGDIPVDNCMCPTDYDPVCGENGVTYDNACLAECNDVFNYSNGDCADIPIVCPTAHRWTTPAQLSSQIDLLDVDFINGLTGWASGDDGLVTHTQDGGQSWTIQNIPAQNDILSIDFVNEMLGFAIEGGAFSSVRQLWKTQDGGQSWEMVDFLNERSLKVFFLDETVGWVLNQSLISTSIYHIRQTTDGGETWNLISAIDYGMIDFHFVDNQNGWAATYDGILRTTNGGFNWTMTNELDDIRKIQFTDNLNGWGIALSNDAFRTTDGGLTWTSYEVTGFSGTHKLTDLHFVSPNEGWIVGYKNFDDLRIFYTSNGGTSWTDQSMNMQNDFGYRLNAISFFDNKLWTVGDAGVIFQSTNGQTWEHTINNPSISPIDIIDVHFIDEQIGWSINDGNTIWKTSDAGFSWELQYNSTQDELLKVFFVDEQFGWAGGENGFLIRTLDGGETWAEIDSELTKDIEHIHFEDPLTGWVIDEMTLIRHTTNGGLSWEYQIVQTAYATEVFFLNETHVWILAWDRLFRTTDGGATWEITSSSLERGRFRNLFFLNENMGWIVGNFGVVAYTEDGGYTWENRFASDPVRFDNVYFTNQNKGWAVAGGGIYFTENGGKNWTRQATNASFGINNIFFNDDNIGWAYTSDGQLIRYEEITPTFENLEYLGELNNKKYYLSTVAKTWGEAQSHANQNGGSLMTIQSEAENDFIQQNISEIVHIGLSDELEEGNYYWINDAQLIYDNVGTCNLCEENTMNHNTGVMNPWNGQWSFGSEFDVRKYIVEVKCQIPFSPPGMNVIGESPGNLFQDDIILLHVFPNPANENISIVINSEKEKIVELNIFDARGVLWQKESISLIEGKNSVQLSIHHLPVGMYTLNIPTVGGKGKRFLKME